MTNKTNKENRMEAMQEAGIDTSKFFNVKIPKNVLECNVAINIVMNENGEVEIKTTTNSENCSNNDVSNNIDKIEKCQDIYKQIYANGYVKNSKLHRRWVMAQMFRMMTETHYIPIIDFTGVIKGYQDVTTFDPNLYNKKLDNDFSYMYQFDMLIEELRVLAKLRDSDYDTYCERAQFFDQYVVKELINDYVNKLKKHLDSLPTKKYKGKPYIDINYANQYIGGNWIGRWVLVDDIYTKIILPVTEISDRIISYIDRGVTEHILYGEMKKLRRVMFELPYSTKKCSKWKAAYKAAGSYYTLMNMIKFHDVKVPFKYWNYTGFNTYRTSCKTEVMSGEKAVKELTNLCREWTDNYQQYRLFALLKDTIDYNKFNFNKRMEEIYKEK